MWFGLFAGWILGSTMLYAYLIATAKEPARPECMDCRQPDCAGCPYVVQSTDAETKRAA